MSMFDKFFHKYL